MKPQTDVCLILEGTYPYISGGVSGWAHQLILSQSHLQFSLISILPPRFTGRPKYDLPKNVASLSHIYLQQLPEKKGKISSKEMEIFFKALELPILNLQNRAKTETLKSLLDVLGTVQNVLGEELLLNSEEAWKMLLRMYRSSIGEGSFLNFFWSWRGLLAGLYAILLADIPNAKVYHSLCTGYAGLYLAKACLSTGRPGMLTEHGIYTNERRIEITAADWLNDQKSMNLQINRGKYEKDLKDYWIDTFSGYSKLCYEACREIITLFQGNTTFQIEDGADPKKIRIIPNGVDFAKYSSIKKDKDHPPTVALIGRVVSIKDVKTFIRSIAQVKDKIPEIRAWVIGPMDEEEEYYRECLELTKTLHLQTTLTFTGKINIMDRLGQIDVVVLTSISEAQPLVLLEAGAAGIPSIATDVGACREMLYGCSDELPSLGQGGIVCPLSNPAAISEGIVSLISNEEFYAMCSKTMRERVKKYYHQDQQRDAYQALYKSLIEVL